MRLMSYGFSYKHLRYFMSFMNLIGGTVKPYINMENQQTGHIMKTVQLIQTIHTLFS